MDLRKWVVENLKSADRLTALLIIISICAIIIRSIPGWLYPAWGSDYGIYFGITQDFLDHPQLFQPYSGWGTSYVYFPVLYVMTALMQGLTGLPLDVVMPRMAPVFGGLTIPILYLTVRDLFNNRKVALLSAAFLAANPFQIYETSHAAPLTVGHFFMALSILFFVKYRKDRFWTGPLYVSTVLLIGSHHLTTYFYLLFLIAVILYRNLREKEWTPHFREDLFYFFTTVTLTFSYWILIATPVFRADFESALHMDPWVIIGIFYILTGAIFVAIPYLRSWPRFRALVKWKLSWPTPKEDVFKVAVIAGCCCAFTLFFSFHHIYGTGFIFLPSSTLFLLPIFITLGIAAAGYRYLDRFPERAFIKAWFLAISASFVFAVVTHNTAIYSFRHLEYMAYPLSVMAAVGVWEMRRYLKKENLRQLLTVSIGSLLVISAVTAYGVQSSTMGFEESISNEAMGAANWMKGNVSTNQTVASDHRLSQILWAKGFRVTSDDAYVMWFTDNWTNAYDELNSTGKNYGRIGFVFIDDIMKDKGIQSGNNETPRPMTNESYEKFSRPPFDLLYRSESESGQKWAEVYSVNWSYIEKNRG